MRDSEEREYLSDWLQVGRPQPMYCNEIDAFIKGFYPTDDIVGLDDVFKEKFVKWLKDHSLNKFTGIDAFTRLDVSYGCTQYIDDLYQRLGYQLKTLKGDYTYHQRLNPDIQYYEPKDVFDYSMQAQRPELLIAMPFPSMGDIHPQMKTILDDCAKFNIPVHIDGAWIGSCVDIDFNFDHPAIKTFCISLSKGGMGSNRVGVRFARETPEGAITIMNDFNMQQQALLKIGIAFLDKFEPEYFWKNYEDQYYQVCQDFKLEPTKCIHLAMRDGGPVGIRPLLRSIKP